MAESIQRILSEAEVRELEEAGRAKMLPFGNDTRAFCCVEGDHKEDHIYYRGPSERDYRLLRKGSTATTKAPSTDIGPDEQYSD